MHFPKETILYMMVSRQADAQKAAKSITNQKAIQSQTISYSSMSDESAATLESQHTPNGDARELDRAPVPKIQEALAWAATPAQSGGWAGLRHPSPGETGKGLRSGTQREPRLGRRDKSCLGGR